MESFITLIESLWPVLTYFRIPDSESASIELFPFVRHVWEIVYMGEFILEFIDATSYGQN